MNPCFTDAIEQWYMTNGRDLPWRQTADPYRIWISEIILQQTQVVQGTDYYHRFLHRFPDVKSLAAASEDEVLLQWQGLGYYSRARNLHAAARQIVDMGEFPQDYQTIRSLRGVGDYTAAAIASIAYGLPYAVIDGNVSRVLTRYLGIDTPIDTTSGKKLQRSLADEMLDRSHPALYNQAIMDFGALQCTPRNPDCPACPLSETCEALRQRLVDQLPRKSRRTKVSHRYFTYLYIRTPEGRVLIQRREQDDIWRGLYQLPLIETDAPLSGDEVADRFPGIRTQSGTGPLTHQLTHRLIHAECYVLYPSDASQVGLKGLWVEEQNLQEYAMPQLLVRIMKKLSL